MGMPIVSIDRAVAAEDDAPQAAGGTAMTSANSTPTFLSTESLTFPGVSLITLGLVQIWNKATGAPATPTQVAFMAGVLGLILIIWGLLGTTNDRKNVRNMIGQIIIGVLNTAVLYGVMIGVSTR